jgi:hypothetical protein
MDASNKYVFAFLPLVFDAYLVSAPMRDVNIALHGCSIECCHTFRQLFRLSNSLRKIMLAAKCVCISLSPMRSVLCDEKKFFFTTLGGLVSSE